MITALEHQPKKYRKMYTRLKGCTYLDILGISEKGPTPVLWQKTPSPMEQFRAQIRNNFMGVKMFKVME